MELGDDEQGGGKEQGAGGPFLSGMAGCRWAEREKDELLWWTSRWSLGLGGSCHACQCRGQNAAA